MKMQKINQSKFEVFKSDELQNPIFVSGGRIEGTTWTETNTQTGQQTNSGCDKWRTGPDIGDTPTSTHWGVTGDMVDTPCSPAGGGEETPFVEHPGNDYTFTLLP